MCGSAQAKAREVEEPDLQGNVGLHLKSSEKRFWDLEQLGFYVEDVEATSWDPPEASVPLLVSRCLSCLRALCTPGHHGLVPPGLCRAPGVWPLLWSLQEMQPFCLHPPYPSHAPSPPPPPCPSSNSWLPRSFGWSWCGRAGCHLPVRVPLPGTDGWWEALLGLGRLENVLGRV